MGDLTPGELREALKVAGGAGHSGMERALAQMPQSIPLRLLAHAAAYISTICEASPAMLTYLADRSDGKVKDESQQAQGAPVNIQIVMVDRRRPLEQVLAERRALESHGSSGALIDVQEIPET